MRDETKLLPCPFCGGEDIDEYEGDFGNGVYCMTCGAMMGEPIHLEFRTDERVTYEQAAEAWNTRTPEQAIAATPGKQGYYTDRDDEGTHIMCDRCGEYIGTAEAIAATFCGGKLTAEQVREAIEHHGTASLGCRWQFTDRNLQALADELNAELGSETCELVETDSYSNANEVIHVLECSECGETCEHVNGIYPRCPHCGAKVKEGGDD